MDGLTQEQLVSGLDMVCAFLSSSIWHVPLRQAFMVIIAFFGMLLICVLVKKSQLHNLCTDSLMHIAGGNGYLFCCRLCHIR